MSIEIKRATLWSIETPNTPGAMAHALRPLADGGANLDLVMGYANSDKTNVTIEVFPVTTPRAKKAARDAGFSKSDFPCLVVTGKNRTGIGRDISAALSEASINVNFFSAQVLGTQYVGLFSFEAESEANLAVRVLKKSLAKKPAAKGPRGSTGKKTTKRKA